MPKLIRILAACAAGLVMEGAALAAGPTPEQIAAESAKANTFFDRVFDEAVARSPEYLTQLGMKTDNDKWDDDSDARRLEDFLLGVQQFAELRRTINPEALDDQTRVSYRMFVDSAERSIEGWRWRYHNYPISQEAGPHSDAPALLINYHAVDNVADARAYLARLRGMGAKFDQAIDGMKIRAARGIIPPRFVFPMAIESCREVIRGEPFDPSGKGSALLEDFTAKVTALRELDDTSRAQLIGEARTALTDSVRPAYEKLIASLEEQQKAANEDDGVWKFPDGQEYYAFVLRRATTTRLTADEIHQLGLSEVARIHREMEGIMKTVGFKGDLQAFFRFLKEDPQFTYPATPEGRAAYMTRATAIIDAMRNRLDEFFITKPRAPLVIKQVEPFRERGASAAFYEPPSLDGTRPGAYYVNMVDMRSIPIFEMETLVHHEAIPGHHMQTAIAQELTGIPKFRKYGGNSAYTEGWALYAEYFPKEFGFYTDPYQDFGRLYDELLRAVRLVVDPGLHAKRWTRAQVMDYFRKNTPNPENDIVTESNRYIVRPGNATAYKIGMLKILELRELARRELGLAFSLREYHDLLLRSGPVPMNLLEENVRDWIARKKG